ncbi:MAG TPA: lipopolysaccharide assembly protein LapA domain-containing protein [Thermoleophilaceae bacterium]|nr:lipopolysaccharide assembly protein LapA domain-containing protein [Thermoleophilaceae bacterium]
MSERFEDRPEGMRADPTAPESAGAPAPARERERRPERPGRTRTSAAFKALILALIVLILLLVFILENTQRVKVSYFGATGHLPLGVALLLAAVGGAIITASVGGARIVQLRRQARRSRRRPPD